MRQVDKKNDEIIDLQYFGDIKLYSTLIKGTDVYFYPESSYEKSIHLNRTVINGANGPIPLSIPLLGGRNQKGFFKDVQIAEHGNWRRTHWRSIHDSYRKSPWFEELGWQLEAFYQKPEKFLLDWNLKTMEWVIKVLKLDVAILTGRVKSIDAGSTKFETFSDTDNSEVNYPIYQQVFMDRTGFVHNLSILDLLFCEGPASLTYLGKLAM